MTQLIKQFHTQLMHALQPILHPTRLYRADAEEQALLTADLARMILLFVGLSSVVMGLTAAAGLFEMTFTHALLLWLLAAVELISWWLIGHRPRWTHFLFGLNLIVYTLMLAPLVVAEPQMTTILFAAVFPILGAFILINRREGLLNLIIALLLPDLVQWLGGPPLNAEQHYNYVVFTLTGGVIGMALATLIQTLIARLSEQVAQLTHMATHDPLTGALNRKGLQEHGEIMLSAHLRKANMPMTAAIIDLDFFKAVNDTWGHEAGDEVLRILVGQIQQCFTRKSDLLARLGGDEFVLLLADTPLQNAHRLLVELAQHLQENLPRYKNHTMPVALSIGAAGLKRGEHETLDDLLREADARVYRAKEAGRSHVCSEIECTDIPTAFEKPASTR